MAQTCAEFTLDGTIQKGYYFCKRDVMPRKLVLWSTILLVAVTTLACIGVGGSRTLPVGESAPNFGIKIGSKTKTLNGYQGNAVIVVFWSST